ncbi:hypothetical protein, partial [Pseudomonas putida]|uniref:hypothetical protein n=1 Tax=Pseudomonas putida TaxID=303 RepID=UPI001E29DACC
ALSTIISTAVDHSIVALSTLSEQSNLLNLNKFFVPMSLEVGRIIRGFERASTFNFKKLSYRRKAKRGGLSASPLLYSYTCRQSLGLEGNPCK